MITLVLLITLKHATEGYYWNCFGDEDSDIAAVSYIFIHTMICNYIYCHVLLEEDTLGLLISV